MVLFFLETLRAADTGNELVVLLVDPRAATSPTYAEALERYDGIDEMNSGAVVVWNTTDTDIDARPDGGDPIPRPDIESALQRILSTKMTKGNRTFHPMIFSVDNFTSVFLDLLTDMRCMVLKNREPKWKPKAERHIGTPRLTGPVVS